MDNFRRMFLTKDEVRNLGNELTENTTDDIAAIYLPVNGIPELANNPILFKYRTKEHTDLVVNNNVSGKYANTLGHADYNIELHNQRLSFGWYHWEDGTIGNNYGVTVNFTRISAENKSRYGSYNPTYSLFINEHMGYDTDWYIRIDVTKINCELYAISSPSSDATITVNDFLMQYLSGTIPPDTIFYEPYGG